MKTFKFFTSLSVLFISTNLFSQTFNWEGHTATNVNVTSEIIQFDGSQVLKIERDLIKLPFEIQRLGATVDEPTYVKLDGVNFSEGIIEFEFYSSIQDPTPFPASQGFIGLAFRINEKDTEYECIYLRPKVGRSSNQEFRNRTVQYYAYPNYKFDVLRKDFGGKYETTAPVDINEWVKYRIEIKGDQAELFINDAKYSTFIVDKLLSNSKSGSIGLWVDIGTVGYFKNLKVISN